jgi:hypothetical protein
MRMPLLNIRLLQSMQGCCKLSSPSAQVADFAAIKKTTFLTD